MGRLYTTAIRMMSDLWRSSTITYSGVLSYCGSDEASRVTRQCVRIYRATPPPALPIRSCRRRLYPGNCKWETESKGVRKVSVIAIASKFFVDVYASSNEKWA